MFLCCQGMQVSTLRPAKPALHTLLCILGALSGALAADLPSCAELCRALLFLR